MIGINANKRDFIHSGENFSSFFFSSQDAEDMKDLPTDLPVNSLTKNSFRARYLSQSDMAGSADLIGWSHKLFHDDFLEPDLGTNRSAHWSVAWSDLMMVMFILFMTMFVFKISEYDFLSYEKTEEKRSFESSPTHQASAQQGKALAGSAENHVSQSFSKLYDFSQLNITQEELQEFASIHLNPDKTVRIIIAGDLLFSLGQAQLLPDSKKSLKKIAAFLQQTSYKINVVGHTDDLPINSTLYPSNWELSTGRAGAVTRYLIEQSGLPAEQFYISGYSQYRPTVSNGNPVNRARNRRVEIIVTKEEMAARPFSGDLSSIRS